MVNEPPEKALQSLGRRIQWLSISPLLIAGAIYLLVPSVQDTLHDGLRLLVAGDIENLQVWATKLGFWAPLATLALMICQAIAAPIPAILVTATNSLLFGPFWGGLYSIFSANIAAALCYGLARGYGAGVVEKLVSPTTHLSMANYLQHNGMATVVIARLIPFVPFDPISYLAGLGKMPFWPFFWATMIGQFPAGMAYSYLVHQAAEPSMGIVYSLTTILALLTLGMLAKRYLRPEEKQHAVDHEPVGLPAKHGKTDEHGKTDGHDPTDEHKTDD